MRYDVVIVGSGFGGAVMAARLGAHLGAQAKKKSVLVLEKGWDPSGALDPQSDGGPVNAQGNRFQQTLSPSYMKNVVQLHTDARGVYREGVPSLNIATGIGFGGGSNVYDGVSLRAPAVAFDQQRAGRRLWPAIYSRAALEPFYARVEARLGVRRVAWSTSSRGGAAVPYGLLATKRDYVFAEGCRRIGAAAAPLKLADSANDANEGWWNGGQRFEGRQDLTKNYLRDAKAAGVELWSGCEIQKITPTADGYVVSGFDRRGGAHRPIEIDCTMLVVSGGAVGSTSLLLSSKDAFGDARAIDPANLLGKEVSGNGDYGVSGIVGKDYELDVDGFKGKPMSSFCPTFFAEHGFVLIPFYAAPLYLTLGQPSTLLRPKDPSARGRASTVAAPGEKDWGLAYKQRLQSFGPRMMTMGCLALDACEGEIALATTGRPHVSWRETAPTTEARWTKAVETMRKIYEALGGEMYLDGYRKDGTVNTAHPLGGCRMSERGDGAGVVDPTGEAVNNRNLFVIDAALVPSALGVNPSLTIAAVAESIADRLIAGSGTEPLASRL